MVLEHPTQHLPAPLGQLRFQLTVGERLGLLAFQPVDVVLEAFP